MKVLTYMFFSNNLAVNEGFEMYDKGVIRVELTGLGFDNVLIKAILAILGKVMEEAQESYNPSLCPDPDKQEVLLLGINTEKIKSELGALGLEDISQINEIIEILRREIKSYLRERMEAEKINEN